MTSVHPLLQRLGLSLPIVQAPMAGVSTPAMAAAVSEAGGLGSLGIGAMTAAQAHATIAETRQLTRRPIHVNLFCHQPARRDAQREAAWLRHLQPLFHQWGAPLPATLNEIYPSFTQAPDVLAVILQARPEVLSFHFGLPTPAQLQAIRAAGIFTMATATNLDEAQQIAQAGVDAVIAQGIEAGGHRGMFDPDAVDEGLSTFTLVQALVRHCPLPVVAAGGIMDGRGIRAMLSLGAAAAQLGTAFVLCPESAASAGYRAQLGGADRTTGHITPPPTRLTRVISGRPARGLVNALITHGEQAGSPPPPDYAVAYDAAKQLHAAAARQGSSACAAHWAGQGASLARALPARELVAALAREMALDVGADVAPGVAPEGVPK